MTILFRNSSALLSCMECDNVWISTANSKIVIYGSTISDSDSSMQLKTCTTIDEAEQYVRGIYNGDTDLSWNHKPRGVNDESKL